VQHVRAIGIQIQAKVLETGYQVDMDGLCWASRPEIDRPTAGKNVFGEQTRQHSWQQNLTQEDGPGQDTDRWREDRGGDHATSGAAGRQPDNVNVNNSAITRSMHKEEWEDEDRRRSLRGRRRDQRRRRRRSWQASHYSEEDSRRRPLSATNYHGLLTSPPRPGAQHPLFRELWPKNPRRWSDVKMMYFDV